MKIHTSSSVAKKWLITGGCGFIGTSCVHRLMERSSTASIIILDNLMVGTREDLRNVCSFSEVDPDQLISENHLPASREHSAKTSVKLVVGDICNFDTCLKLCRDIDVVVHLAANTGVGPSVENPRADMEANVIGTFNMLEAAKKGGVQRFVFASSGAPVGECEPPIHEELAPHPVSPYGASKLCGEAYCSAFFRTFGMETVALRFGNVYGPGSGHKNSVVAKFIRQAMEGKCLEVYGDGRQTRDFIYIEDLIRAILLAASVENIGGETFQIATNAETTVIELVQKLLPIMKTGGIKIPKVIHGQPRLGDVRRNFSDTSKARRLLGWQPEVSLEEGLRRTFLWFIGK